MTILLAVFVFVGAFGAAVGMRLLTEETCGWIRRMPILILRVAASRIPKEFREGLYEEWEAELIYELRDTGDRPITRLLTGMHYAFSLIRGSKKTAGELGATREYRDSVNQSIESKMVHLRHEKLGEDVDAILDDIDEVFDENAEDFLRSYVQKGGQ